MASKIAESYIRELEHGDRFSQWMAAKKLGTLGDRTAVEPLIRCLFKEDDVLRKFATASLGNLGDSQAVESLVRCLDSDKEQPVRWEAAVSLGKLGSPEAVEPLLRALCDEDGGMRRRAADSLKRLGVGPASLTLSIQTEDELVQGEFGRLSIQVVNNGQGPALGLKVVLSGPFSGKQREYNIPPRLGVNGEITVEDAISPDKPGYIPLELSVTYRDVARPDLEVLKYRDVSIKVRERQAHTRRLEAVAPPPLQVYGEAKISYGPVTEVSGDWVQPGAIKQQEGVAVTKAAPVPGAAPFDTFLFCPYCGTRLGLGQTPEACPNPQCRKRLR